MMGAMLSVAHVKKACKYMSGWVCTASTMSIGSVIFAIEISLASKELWQRDRSAMYIKQSFLATLATHGQAQTPSCFSQDVVCSRMGKYFDGWCCFSLGHPLNHGFKGGSHSSCWKITVDASKSGTFAYASKYLKPMHHPKTGFDSPFSISHCLARDEACISWDIHLNTRDQILILWD